MGFLCVSEHGEFKNIIKNVFGGSPCQTKFAKKVEKKQTLFLSFFPSIFVYRVLACFSA
jgi:hypothetical protein